MDMSNILRQCKCCSDENDVWKIYCNEDSTVNLRTPALFNNHPTIFPKMRSILLEWMVEVCIEYKLNRETYYLALDYLDRYLSATKGLPLKKLQLTGVTCLALAAKYEEIHPPKMSEFAATCDGACSEQEIIDMEWSIVTILDWKCTIISPNNWLTAYMQLIYQKDSKCIMIPQYSVELFERVARLLDIASLDKGFLKFPYRVHATSALYLGFSKHLALSVSGMELSDIHACVRWMTSFWKVIKIYYGYNEDIFGLHMSIIADQQLKCEDLSHTIITQPISLTVLEAGQTILHLEKNKRGL